MLFRRGVCVNGIGPQLAAGEAPRLSRSGLLRYGRSGPPLGWSLKQEGGASALLKRRTPPNILT